MPALKAKRVRAASMGAHRSTTCVIKFFWDEKPERSRPSHTLCLGCAIAKLEGSSITRCGRTLGDPRHCFDCASNFRVCHKLPDTIAVYRGELKFKDEVNRVYDDYKAELLAELNKAEIDAKLVYKCNTKPSRLNRAKADPAATARNNRRRDSQEMVPILPWEEDEIVYDEEEGFVLRMPYVFTSEREKHLKD